MTKFQFEVVAKHIRKKHPGCPEFAVEYIANEIAGREWEKVTLGKAVGIVMTTALRHLMTDYDTLLLHGVERQEARRRVQPRVNAMLKVWLRKQTS